MHSWAYPIEGFNATMICDLSASFRIKASRAPTLRVWCSPLWATGPLRERAS